MEGEGQEREGREAEEGMGKEEEEWTDGGSGGVDAFHWTGVMFCEFNTIKSGYCLYRKIRACL